MYSHYEVYAEVFCKVFSSNKAQSKCLFKKWNCSWCFESLVGASCTLGLDVVRAAFDLQAESRPHLRDGRETPGRLGTVRVTAVVLLQTPKRGKRKEREKSQSTISSIDFQDMFKPLSTHLHS